MTTPTFQRWAGPLLQDTYNGKAVLDCGGRPAFAELAVLWAFRADGWDGVWIDTYRNAFRTGYWNCPAIPDLPTEAATLLERINKSNESRLGAWDVFCWRGSEVKFVECKRKSRDAIRDSQVRWLGAALAVGHPVSDFLVAEWSIID